jgi:hypothetical protein
VAVSRLKRRAKGGKHELAEKGRVAGKDAQDEGLACGLGTPVEGGSHFLPLRLAPPDTELPDAHGPAGGGVAIYGRGGRI